jgi:hypothetical protein
MRVRILAPLCLMAVIGTIGAVALVIAFVTERSRRDGFRGLARELKFKFFEEGRLSVVSPLRGFQIFDAGHLPTVLNHLRGLRDDAEVDIFDYRGSAGRGRYEKYWTHTVLSARVGGMNVPHFRIIPRHFLDKIGNLLGFQDVTFDSHPQFSRMYLLKGKGEKALRRLFSPNVLEYFEDHPGLKIYGFSDRFVFYASGRLSVSRMRDFVAEGFAVLDVVRHSDQTARSKPRTK